jgi:hypothetical protein
MLEEVKRAMKRKLPLKACVRCQNPTSCRRDGRPLCLGCWVVLTNLEMDKELRRMGKLKGTRGRT